MIGGNGIILSVLEYALMLPRMLLGSPATKRLWTTKSPPKNAGVLGKIHQQNEKQWVLYSKIFKNRPLSRMEISLRHQLVGLWLRFEADAARGAANPHRIAWTYRSLCR
jgi:hypothetical protein